MRKKSLKIWNLRRADRLTPHHDSQFSAFSTKVFIRINQEHNRNSSPFTTLADKTECKVVSTWAGQPNYWPKTWFGANAYNAKIQGAELYCKSVRTFIVVTRVVIKPLAD